MDAENPLEKALARALASPCSSDCPPRLAEVLQYAIFPGGARVRPKLVLAVAQACGKADMAAALAGACAIEMLHCASLVHDDLPCFDGAAYRRGKPSVHVAYGERLAVLRCEAAGGEGSNRWYAIVTRGASGKAVRQLFERQGATVSRVLRIRFGALTLDRTLPRGRSRALTDAELAALLPGAGCATRDAGAAAPERPRSAPSSRGRPARAGRRKPR